MSFYHNNMLSFLLQKKDSHNFRLLSEQIGVLIIFDQNFNAQCIFIESWDKTLNKLTDEENDAIKVAQYFYNKIGLIFYFIKYSDSELNNGSQILYKKYDNMKGLKLCTLFDFFTHIVSDSNVNFRINLNQKHNIKVINDSISTPFHKWQRDNLSYDGFPVDIDIALVEDENVLSLIEIKRSRIQNWKPYKADKNNYLAMCKFCDRLETNFFLFFISQQENGGQKIDDYEHIDIYDIYHKIGNYKEADNIYFKKIKTLSLNELLKYDFFQKHTKNETWMNK